MIILEVEDIKQRSLFDFHKELFNQIENPRVLVLLWTTNDSEKKKKYESILEDYFKDLGAEVFFLKENDQELKEKFDKNNIVYLPGGDTSILLENLNKHKEVIEALRNFNGVIIGNSAGAIALAREGYGHKNGKIIRYLGLGLVNVKILVHFEWNDLNILNEKEIIPLKSSDHLIILD